MPNVAAILLLISLSIASTSYAQWSPAFDSNCYFPVIGQPGTMDTLYGSRNDQDMGRIFIDMRSKAEGPSDRAMISGMPKNLPFVSTVDLSNGLDLNSLKIEGKCQLPLGRYQTGNFRSPRVKDLLYGGLSGGLTIFWADDSGNYDTSRYTELLSDVYRLFGKHQGSHMPFPLIARVSVDSLDDIIWEANTQYASRVIEDTSYLVWWKGGEALAAKGKVAREDSLLFWSRIVVDTMGSVTGYRRIWQGDFRGTGRQDVVAMDGHRNYFFFRNDPPFTLSKLAQAMEFDTLIADWQNPLRRSRGSNLSIYEYPFVMRALPRAPFDSSMDLFLPLKVGDDHRASHYIFRGGSSFGSHRLTDDSAEVVLKHPAEYDFANFGNLGDWGASFENCGDMTGSGDPVIHTTSFIQGSSHHYFYVLGKAIDDKVDAYTVGGYFGDGPAISVNANNDKYGDALIAARGLTTLEDYDRGKKYVGSLQLLYGTDQIPHQPKPQYLSVKRRGEYAQTVRVVQRTSALVMTGLPLGRSRLQIYNILGQLVWDSEIDPIDGTCQLPCVLPTGMYFLEIARDHLMHRQGIFLNAY